ncbi:hypothetical protein FVEG_09809 [Fusarium verticillioides 7600]|uniref:Uncharacterized protein n=1 Tax=Gibberella moniliformis (strain M3125 / FGSC 7600) TaxID=334819 RepID=W7MIE1_GIBM7|nr:hypothetical protein FVEG_09809 [Fusarium verticillioides 7600]EWG50661.1 hypothetical protein FVEG_09809 [Fusarium verticillioides 7600]
MINDTNQLSNSARKLGAKAKKGGSDEEPSALKLQEAPPRARSQPPKLKETYASEEIMRGRTLTRETDEARDFPSFEVTSGPFPARLISDGEGTEHRIERAGDVMVAARRSV